MDFFDRMGEKLVTAGKDVTQKIYPELQS